jgi:hypothetical protein
MCFAATTSRFTPSTCCPIRRGGAFVGGCDIVREMHETGELGELFASSNVSAATDVAS